MLRRAGRALVLFLVLVGFAWMLHGCEPKPHACGNFERVAVGSGCRDTSTGGFVDAANCDC